MWVTRARWTLNGPRRRIRPQRFSPWPVPPTSSPQVLEFGDFALDLRAGELVRNGGDRVLLPEQPFRVLATLVRRPGELVTREDLQQELWSDDTFVDFEHGLNSTIKRLREALGEISRGAPLHRDPAAARLPVHCAGGRPCMATVRSDSTTPPRSHRSLRRRLTRSRRRQPRPLNRGIARRLWRGWRLAWPPSVSSSRVLVANGSVPPWRRESPIVAVIPFTNLSPEPDERSVRRRFDGRGHSQPGGDRRPAGPLPDVVVRVQGQATKSAGCRRAAWRHARRRGIGAGIGHEEAHQRSARPGWQ